MLPGCWEAGSVCAVLVLGVSSIVQLECSPVSWCVASLAVWTAVWLVQGDRATRHDLQQTAWGILSTGQFLIYLWLDPTFQVIQHMPFSAFHTSMECSLVTLPSNEALLSLKHP